MDRILSKFIAQFQNVTDKNQYSEVVQNLIKELKEVDADLEIIKKIKSYSNFMVVEYSEKETLENMKNSKRKLIEYLDEVTYNSKKVHYNYNDMNFILEKILNNFIEFKQNFFERIPHKTAGIKQEKLKEIENQIKNEYDIQHILFALIKLIFESARTEVSEDTGFSTVRSDIYIPEILSVVEVKYSRENMAVKQLSEQIAADIIHYSFKNIYFFIYDKCKIIDNISAFKKTYEKSIGDKKVYVIVHQPKNL